MTAIIKNELENELRTKLEKERDLRFSMAYNKIGLKFGLKSNQKSESKLESKLDNLEFKEYPPKLKSKNLCISGNKCKNKLCMSDIVDVFNIHEYAEPEDILCKVCLEHIRHKIKSRSKSIDARRLDRLVAVRIADILRDYKNKIDKFGCGCDSKDCKYGTLNDVQIKSANNNFNTLYYTHTSEILPTRTNV